ncbi:MAG: NUDIX domain-containing protein [Bacteroidota bacterium]
MNPISSELNHFNLRIYGVYIENGHLLLSDEFRFGRKMTKLPGGGLEFGEGIADALRREWMEELQTKIEVGEVLYVNPFLQISSFNPKDQVICLYFRVYLLESLQVEMSERAYDFPLNGEDQQSFRWKKLVEISEEDFTFPIDKAALKIIKTLQD